MTNRWLTGWLQAEPWLRVVSFTLAALLLAGLLWLCWLHPAQRQLQTLEQQQRLQARRYSSQISALRLQPALQTVQQQITQLQQQSEPAKAHLFSLPRLLAHSGAVLEHWHPTPHGGELALTLSWAQFGALLGYLTTLQPSVEIPRFRLKRAGAQLHLVLELNDAS